MSQGSRYSQQFKEDALRYRKDHPELTLKQTAKNLGISDSVLKSWMRVSKESDCVVNTQGSSIMQAMKQKKLQGYKENYVIPRMRLKY